MMKYWTILTALALSSCDTLKTAQSPDFDKSEVQSGIFLTCSGYKTWQHCYEAANKACPSGYSIISKDENQVSQARTLRIECKK